MLVFGAAVVVNRNPVASALSLVVSFLGLAALFMSLDAFFIGIIQVLVYAGAVMVLFLFIIMLLDFQAEEAAQDKRRRVRRRDLVSLRVDSCRFVLVIGTASGRGEAAFPPLAAVNGDDVRNVGMLLFSNYNLPFQIIGVLVLVATVGVIVLSKRETALSMVTLGDYLLVSGLLFTIGFAGVMLRRNIIIIFMSLELMLNAANLSLVAFSRFHVGADGLPNYNAQVFVFFIITVAAAEVAVGLAIIVALYRARQTTHVEDISTLKF